MPTIDDLLGIVLTEAAEQRVGEDVMRDITEVLAEAIDTMQLDWIRDAADPGRRREDTHRVRALLAEVCDHFDFPKLTPRQQRAISTAHEVLLWTPAEDITEVMVPSFVHEFCFWVAYDPVQDTDPRRWRDPQGEWPEDGRFLRNVGEAGFRVTAQPTA